MKKNRVWVNVIFVLISILISILTLASGLLVKIAGNNINVNIMSTKGTNYISYIRIGETKYNINDFTDSHGLELLDKNKESTEDDRLILKNGEKLNFEISKIHNLAICYDKTEKSSVLKIEYGKKVTDIKLDNESNGGCYYITNSMSSLILEQISNFDTLDYFILISLFIVFSILYYIIIRKIIDVMGKIKEKESISLFQIIILFILYFIINILCCIPLMEILNKWYFIVVFIQLIIIIYYLRNFIKNKLHIVFVFLAIVLSVNMAILIPPFHVPDELTHYYKAYSIFNKHDGPSLKLDKKVYNTITKYTNNLHGADYRTSFKEYFVDANIKESKNKTINVTFKNTYDLNSFTYIPSAITIKISQIFKMPFMFSALLARIVNALIFIILGYYAIKITPYFKKIFFVIMLFPITIQQVAAVNQDSITLSIIFFLIAYILSLIYGKENKISNKQIFVLYLLSFFLGMCKPIYFPITLLIFLIPNKKFKSNKKAILLKIIPIILCTILCATKLLPKGSDVINSSTNELFDLSYAISNPIAFIKIVINTFIQRGNLDLLTGQVNLFGWSTVYYDYIFSFLTYYAYLFILLSDNEKNKKLKTKNKLLILFVVLVIIGLIYLSALFGFSMTYKTSEIIGGLQSRYFIPVTLLIFIFLSSDFIKTKAKNKNMPSIILTIVVYLISFYTIIKGFYM